MHTTIRSRGFAADEPPPKRAKPFFPQTSHPPNGPNPPATPMHTLESERFLESCSKTLIDLDLVLKKSSSLISAVCKALDESDNSIFATDSFPANSDGGFVPETEFDDLSFVPYREFDDLSFVPETDLSFVPETEFEDGVEACGGDPRASKLVPSSVTAEELSAMDSPPWSPTRLEMMRILLPRFFTLVRSFPYLFLVVSLVGLLL